jgi:hypothetical protein
MAMANGYIDAIANAGAALISHIGLVDDEGTELTGGSPAYARVAVTWTTASGGSGTVRPNADLTFNVPASTTVGGWRGFTALTEGTNYGGADLDNETFVNQGEYELTAASTGIIHAVPA